MRDENIYDERTDTADAMRRVRRNAASPEARLAGRIVRMSQRGYNNAQRRMRVKESVARKRLMRMVAAIDKDAVGPGGYRA